MVRALPEVSVKSNGSYWVNPFAMKHRISLRARNFNSEQLKVIITGSLYQ